MPELPDVVVYLERMSALFGGAILRRVRIASPFVLRTVEPPLAEFEGKRLLSFERIVYASNECNYCASCQTGGKILADRALSRLLKKNWPRRLEDLEGS